MAEEHAPWDSIIEALAAGDATAAAAVVEELDAHGLARGFAHLDNSEVDALLQMLDAPTAADTLERLPEAQAADLIGDLEPSTAAGILSELSVRDQADLLESLPDREAEEILASMPAAVVEPLRSLSGFDDETAGALMNPEFVAFEASMTLRAVVNSLQSNAEEFSDYQVQYLHVVEDGRFQGVVRLRDLLFHPPDSKVGALTIPGSLRVEATTSLDDLAAFFEDHRFLGVPVVNAEGVLLGVVQREMVLEAIAEHTEGEFLRARGIVGGEELRSFPLLTRSGRRLSWLSINVVLNVLAASVIAFYQDTLEAVIALAAFLPIISDMSGCSGNQAVAVSMRELSLGIVTPRDAFYVWRKELGVALINGMALGLLLGGVAWLWQGNLYLALVVGVALSINTVVAVSIGGVVPLVLRSFKLDPALASGPILTTVTDMSGFLLALGMATMFLGRIVGA